MDFNQQVLLKLTELVLLVQSSIIIVGIIISMIVAFYIWFLIKKILNQYVFKSFNL